MTREEYMNSEETDRTKLHREYYSQYVDDHIIQLVHSSIGRKRIIESTDEHFNDIPLKLWDNLAPRANSFCAKKLKENGESAVYPMVCILKEAARQIKEKNLNLDNYKIVQKGKYEIKFSLERLAGNSFAHFSILSKDNSDYDPGFCADHETIRKEFPEFVYLLKWHLATLETGPMHYEANAIYWAEIAAGVSKWESRDYDPNPIEAFKTTVALRDGEKFPSLKLEDGEDKEEFIIRIKKWLRNRLSSLLYDMKKDMVGVGLVKE